MGLYGKKACYHGIFALTVVVLGKGFDMLPLPMRRIVVPMDGAIHLLSIPMMCKPTFLDLGPPKIQVAFIYKEHS